MRILFLSAAFFVTVAMHANDKKIERRLSHLLEKGKLEKCAQSARKFRKKHPDSEVPDYYLSKVYIVQFSGSSQHKSRYHMLKQSIRYANLLSGDYAEYQTSLKDSLLMFIGKHAGLVDNEAFIMDVIGYYRSQYGDTSVLQNYFTEANQSVSETERMFSSMADSLRWRLTSTALTLQGIAYHYTGEKPETGFDCSGFTKYVYSQAGIELPHNAQKQSQLDGSDKTLEDARPGDLVFFGYGNGTNYQAVHAGIIYSNENGEITVAHCVSGGVSIDGKDSSFDHYWKDKVLFVKSLPQLEER